MEVQHDLILRRRALLLASASSPFIGLTSCVFAGAFPKPEIGEQVPTDIRPILAPAKVKNAASALSSFSIDVHAHFFNACDVPIRDYIAGPIAHSKGGLIGELLAALAPIAEWIGNNAPTAANEFGELVAMARLPAIQTMDSQAIARSLDKQRDDYMKELSPRFYRKLLELPKFVFMYNAAKLESVKLSGATGEEALQLDESSLLRIMQRDVLRSGSTVQSFNLDEPPPYVEGVLAFVGYMLSYRWMNLIAYQRAFTTEKGAFGINQVLGALVDFDHWLSPPPRTAHEDQIKLHQLLSQLSGGYMRPLVAYNPWSDVRDHGKTLQRSLDAIDKQGFVGAKIYPPNGYRPFGNNLLPLPPSVAGQPTPVDLDRVLRELWRECGLRNVPVMSHASHSMGYDNAREDMAGPLGWRALLNEIGESKPARANLGHFGGDTKKDTWTSAFAELMTSPAGAELYGDLGYWDGLMCNKGIGQCATLNRLKQALISYPVVAERLMYGSDWLMLSQERRWDRYPFDVLKNMPPPLKADALFSHNAKKCFPNLLLPS